MSSANPTIPLGLCQCGCGEKTWVPSATNTKAGYIKGVPVLFRKGHKPPRRGDPKQTFAIDGQTCCSIPLTQGKSAIVNVADYERLSRWRWCAKRDRNTWYAIRKVRGVSQTFYMHREIANAPAGSKVDHQDGDGLHNWRANIRVASNVENTHNQRLRSTNRSGFKGVSWHAEVGRWRADIRGKDGKSRYLGLFDKATDAARAYDAAALEQWGEFARLNFSNN